MNEHTQCIKYTDTGILTKGVYNRVYVFITTLLQRYRFVTVTPAKMVASVQIITQFMYANVQQISLAINAKQVNLFQ